jgi:hypothetical protein
LPLFGAGETQAGQSRSLTEVVDFPEEECMSLRDFNAPFPDDPTALHTAPLGNSAGLESFHTTQPEDVEPNNMPKIVGGVVVALMVGVAGVALYASSGNHPKPVVAASNLPTAPAPAEPAQMAMATEATTPPPAAETTPPTAPAVTPAEKTPAPVKSASIAKKHVASSAPTSSTDTSANSARVAADTSPAQPQQQQAMTPPAPQPSPSDVATNNVQSGAAVPQDATTASDIPAPQPQQPQSATPTPDQQTAQQAGQQPAAAQSAGQAAQ